MTHRSCGSNVSPTQTEDVIEQALVALRRDHPCWGGRKLRHILIDRHQTNVPAPSTVTHILRRHGLIPERTAGQGRRWKRFEQESPNDLWPMDFKGTIAVGTKRCAPLTVLDDHSRYNLVMHATPDRRRAIVQSALTDTFRQHGLPVRMNMDNGSPWGSPSGQSRVLSEWSLWLVRVGIQVSFSTPAHPQTNGKNERFHRSLKAEVITGRSFTDLAHVRRTFDAW